MKSGRPGRILGSTSSRVPASRPRVGPSVLCTRGIASLVEAEMSDLAPLFKEPLQGDETGSPGVQNQGVSLVVDVATHCVEQRKSGALAITADGRVDSHRRNRPIRQRLDSARSVGKPVRINPDNHVHVRSVVGGKTLTGIPTSRSPPLAGHSSVEPDQNQSQRGGKPQVSQPESGRTSTSQPRNDLTKHYDRSRSRFATSIQVGTSKWSEVRGTAAIRLGERWLPKRRI